MGTINRSNPAMAIPIAAKLPLSKFATLHDATGMVQFLADNGILTGAIGINAQALYLTGHIVDPRIIETLTTYGFLVKKERVVLHALNRRHEPANIDVPALMETLERISTMAPIMSVDYSRRSQLINAPHPLNAFRHLTLWQIPATARQVSLMLPTDSDPKQNSFDAMFLDTVESAVNGLADKIHSESDRLALFTQIVNSEVDLWVEQIEQFYPDEQDSFKAWARAWASYMVMNYPAYREDQAAGAVPLLDDGTFHAPELVKSLASKVAAEAAGAPKPSHMFDPNATKQGAADAPAALAVEEPMRRRDAAALFGIPESSSAGGNLRKVRVKQHLVFQAWQVPTMDHLPVVQTPPWLLAELFANPRREPLDMSRLVGSWFVKSPAGVDLLSPEQFLLQYDFHNVGE